MKNKIFNLISLIPLCGVCAIPFSLVACGKNKEPLIDPHPSIAEEKKSSQFVDRKVTYGFMWEGRRPSENKFSKVSISSSSELPLKLSVTNNPTIQPDQSFNVNIEITNETLPITSIDLFFNIEFDFIINGKTQHCVVENFIARFVPEKLIIDPEKKNYDMVSDINSQQSYTTTDNFTLCDSTIKTSELDVTAIQIGSGDSLGDIFVDVHGYGQQFYLVISTEVFNARANDYNIKIEIKYHNDIVYESTDYHLFFYPTIIEDENKDIKCFPVKDEDGCWEINHPFSLLHSPSSESLGQYDINFVNKPEEFGEMVEFSFFGSPSDITSYTMHIKFSDCKITQNTNWDVTFSLLYYYDGETYVILDDTSFNFYVAPAIDTSNMAVNVSEVEGHTQVMANNLIWVDKFDASFDILDNPIVVKKTGPWPDDIDSINCVIQPTGDNNFNICVDIIRLGETKVLDSGDYYITIKIPQKNQTSNDGLSDQILIYFHI